MWFAVLAYCMFYLDVTFRYSSNVSTANGTAVMCSSSNSVVVISFLGVLISIK